MLTSFNPQKENYFENMLFVSLGSTLLFNSCGSSAEEEAAAEAEAEAEEMVEDLMEEATEDANDVYIDTLKRGERPAEQDDTYYKRVPKPEETSNY